MRRFFLLSACLLGLCSCIHDNFGPSSCGDESLFVLHVAPVSTRGQRAGTAVPETINELRVIAIGRGADGKGVIEINRHVFFDETAASEFGYAFTWRAEAGKKDFYIIANESSVGQVSYSPDITATGLPTSLTEFLDRYPALTGADLHLSEDNASVPNSTVDHNGSLPGGVPDAGTVAAAQGSAEEFCTLIQAVYFAPDLRPKRVEEQEVMRLPYSSCYKDVELQDGVTVARTMYLVPVATKIAFNFVNYRRNEVEINNIAFSAVNSENFLLAHVGEGDCNKTFGQAGEEGYGTYYWVDWLAKVSEASHADGSLGEIPGLNNKYGWISDYEIPAGNQPTVIRLVGTDSLAGDGGNGEAGGGETTTILPRVPAYAEATGTPGSKLLGPYYLPESRNDITQTDTENQTVTEQIYYLTLGLHDTKHNSHDSDPPFNNKIVQNLKALFRNTYLLITIHMYAEESVDVYAEIKDWNYKRANGWVIEGNEPNPNPLTSAVHAH